MAPFPTHAASESYGLLVQRSYWMVMVCYYLDLPDVVALLPVVAKVCADRRCIEEAIVCVSDNNMLRAPIRGEAVLQLLMEFGGLQKKHAYGIIGSMWDILDNVRILAMGQSVAERTDALLLIVVSICDDIPEGVRKNIMETIIANMGTWAYRKAVLMAQYAFDSRLPRTDGVSLTGCEWVTTRWVSDGGVMLGVYTGPKGPSGLKVARTV